MTCCAGYRSPGISGRDTQAEVTSSSTVGQCRRCSRSVGAIPNTCSQRCASTHRLNRLLSLTAWHRQNALRLPSNPLQPLRQRQQRHQRRSGQTVAALQLEVNGNWVVAPTDRPKGIIHFLGGAFAGATPQLTYQLLIKLLADAGYTVIATPFAVTFRHKDCATQAFERFSEALAHLQASANAAIVPADVPVFGVGHSNGCLLHLLIDSFYTTGKAGNVLISFNNKQVGDAIPVPLDPLRDAVSRMQGALANANGPSSAGEVLLGAASALSSAGVQVDRNMVTSVAPFFDQLTSVFAEVGGGTVEFTPTPAENQMIFRSQYRVPSTLLVQFIDDNIDESTQLASILRDVYPNGTMQLKLPGSHVTPCGSDFEWQVGRSFSPTDAVVLGAKAVSQTDIRRMADRIIDWLAAQC